MQNQNIVAGLTVNICTLPVNILMYLFSFVKYFKKDGIIMSFILGNAKNSYQQLNIYL
jgi:hypothetical protein